MSQKDFSIASLIPAVYLPTIVFEAALGAILPVIAVTTRELGGTLGQAGLVVALIGVGHILGDVPAGTLAGRIGDRRAMLLAGGVMVLALIACALAPSLWLFALAVLVTRFVGAVFTVARQAYVTEVAPPLMRARALSTLAGTQRIGTFVGPFAGALVIHLTGTHGAYWLAVALCVIAAGVVLFVPDVAPLAATRQVVPMSFRAILREHRSLLGTLGLAVVLIGIVRGARTTVLPLWTESLGWDPAATSLVFGLSGAVDMLLFYPSGKIMDLRGRLWIGVPSMLTMMLALALLPLTGTVITVSLVAMLLGFGNGIGSGIIMTLGADVAPDSYRSQFLGVWRLLGDAGNATGPLLLSAAAALGSLAAGVWVVSATAGGAAGALARWAPRWSVHASRRTRRAAGL
ncbi:MAG: MFS transporter [Actinomycetales bacterium]|nr:MFS transporter [Actinomycetales bacterium]